MAENKKSINISYDSVLAEFNARTEFLTRIWIWIMIISFFGIIIITQTESDLKLNKITIPIIEISLRMDYFLIVFTIALSGLLIKWIELFKRIARFRTDVIETLIKKRNTTIIGTIKINSRVFIDGIVNSNSISVWGLVPDFKKSNKKILYKIIRLLSYVILKIITIMAHFVFPGLALFLADKFMIDNLEMQPTNSLLIWMVVASSVIVSIFLLSAILTEVLYIWKVILRQILYMKIKSK